MIKSLGMVLPVKRGYNGYFNTTAVVTDQLRANLTNLLLTKRGERMMQPRFGCDVHLLLFSPQTDNMLAEVRASIDSAIREWMPFINIDTLTVNQNEELHRVYVKIQFHLATNKNIYDSIVLVY